MKPHLLILHGAIGAKKQFDSLANILSDNFIVHSLDFDGHGCNCDYVGDLSIDHFVEQTRNAIQDLQLEKPWVFGYSMGGYVALKLEERFPNTIAGLLTLGTKFNWNPEAALHESKMLNPEKIEEKIPAFANYLHTLHGESWKTVLNKTSKMMLEMGDNPPITAETLSKVAIPVKCMRGTKDMMVSHEETRWAVKAIPKARFEEIEEWPHPIDKIPMQQLAREITGTFR